jgi:hypothetical protein
MKTTTEIKARYERELKEATLASAIASQLPVEPKLICIHKDYATVVYGKAYPSRFSFREAMELFRLFTPVAAEHWRDGCLSVQPAEINRNEKRQSAVMVGVSIAEIRLSSGKGYDSHAFIFWIKLGEQYVKVSIELQPDYKWLPSTRFTYNIDGDCTTSEVTLQSIGEDRHTKWWSPPGSYQISYYWEDIHNFDSFAD